MSPSREILYTKARYTSILYIWNKEWDVKWCSMALANAIKIDGERKKLISLNDDCKSFYLYGVIWKWEQQERERGGQCWMNTISCYEYFEEPPESRWTGFSVEHNSTETDWLVYRSRLTQFLHVLSFDIKPFYLYSL